MRLLVLVTFLLFISSTFPQKVTLIQTAEGTNDRLTQKNPLYFGNSTSSLPPLTVDTSQTFQTITGFGGAFTEAAALVFQSLRPDLQEEVLNAYFGPNGLGYSVGRVHINSCDFSTGNWSYDTTENDFELTNFHLTSHDTETVIPFILQALKYHYSWSDTPYNIFATPWSPPAWMKQNGQMDDSTRPLGMKSGDQYLQTWALYFSKFVSAYEEQGVPIWAVTAQNEPNASPRWESCCWTAEAQRDFVRDFLGPKLRKDHPGLKIMIFDDQKLFLDEWLNTVFSDPQLNDYVDGVGFHWYTGDQFWALSNAYQKYPQLFLLPTEACITQPPVYEDWKRGEKYGHDIMGDLQNFAVGWTDWNLLLDQDGGPNHVDNFCDAALIANISSSSASQQTLHYQIPYFYLGHFSKYLPRGSVQVALKLDSSFDSKLEPVAFKTPDNNIVLIVMNRNDAAVSFRIQQAGHSVDSSIPAHSIQTYIYPTF